MLTIYAWIFQGVAAFQGLQLKFMCASILRHSMCAKCCANLIPADFIIIVLFMSNVVPATA
jgi:hypothetical protein